MLGRSGTLSGPLWVSQLCRSAAPGPGGRGHLGARSRTAVASLHTGREPALVRTDKRVKMGSKTS
jgi:hypothetical protein